MGQKYSEQEQKRETEEKFNSVTQKEKPENQNQTHNARKEGLGPINQRR